MAYGFIPTAWRQVKVTLIPKPGKRDYNEAKAYRPISLSSFLSKTMEKTVDRHIRDSALKKYPLHRNQHAYQIGKSTETALHNVVTHMHAHERTHTQVTSMKQVASTALLAACLLPARISQAKNQHEDGSKQGSACHLFHADFLLDLLLNPQDGGNMLFRIIG
jgi:hypothetical protein